MLTNLKILITGCNGFIGKALTERCRLSGWRVIGAVRTNPKMTESGDIPVKVIGDIGPDTDWGNALMGMDIVVHLAAHVETGEKKNQGQREFFRVNTAGTEHLAHCAAQAGVRRFVFLSSIKVHGEASNAFLKESDPPRPSCFYSWSKFNAEKTLWNVSDSTGMEAVVLRPPMVYGPRVKGNFLKLLDVISSGVPLPLGSVQNRRSLIYVGNLVDAILTTLHHPNAAGGTFLVADAQPVSTPELIRKTARLMGAPVRLIRFPVGLLNLAGRAMHRSAQVERLTNSLWADTREIQARLGWRPRISFDQGLGETVTWYRDRTSAAHAHD